MRPPYVIRDKTFELSPAAQEATAMMVSELRYMPFVSHEVQEGMRLNRFKFRRIGGEAAAIVAFMLLDFYDLEHAKVEIVFKGEISTDGFKNDSDLMEHLRQELRQAAADEVDVLFSALA